MKFLSVNLWKTILNMTIYKSLNQDHATDSKEPARSFSMCHPNLFTLQVSFFNSSVNEILEGNNHVCAKGYFKGLFILS